MQIRNVLVGAALVAAVALPASGVATAAPANAVTTPCGPWLTHFWCGIPGGDITFHWWHWGMSLFDPHGPVTP